MQQAAGEAAETVAPSFWCQRESCLRRGFCRCYLGWTAKPLARLVLVTRQLADAVGQVPIGEAIAFAAERIYDTQATTQTADRYRQLWGRFERFALRLGEYWESQQQWHRAFELCGQPVRVTEIAPGLVKTEEFSLVRFHGDAERAESVYAGIPGPLTADDIADCITWAVTRPSHVNIDMMVVRPRAQAAQHKVHREPTP